MRMSKELNDDRLMLPGFLICLQGGLHLQSLNRAEAAASTYRDTSRWPPTAPRAFEEHRIIRLIIPNDDVTHVPLSTMFPSRRTRIWSAWMIVERRWATIRVVRRSQTLANDDWMLRSVWVSSADVAWKKSEFEVRGTELCLNMQSPLWQLFQTSDHAGVTGKSPADT
jgi:hypothetical protein